VTKSFAVFEILCFLVGITSVTPQILLPLAADLAPPEKRAAALSFIFSGLLLGVLVARVLSGIVAQYVSWRVVYYLSIGLQYTVLLGVYLVVPDYPSKNKGMSYLGILGTMLKFTVTEPVLVQACLINFASSAIFSSLWVTLTLLLGQSPYKYETYVICE